jgi:hypothetical protein
MAGGAGAIVWDRLIVTRCDSPAPLMPIISVSCAVGHRNHVSNSIAIELCFGKASIMTRVTEADDSGPATSADCGQDDHGGRQGWVSRLPLAHVLTFRDGKLSFEEFANMVANTDVVKQLTLEEMF